MEQKYIDELKKLGFDGDIENVNTVLGCRAYHNDWSSVTDSSYAVLQTPLCLEKAEEIKLFKKVTDVITAIYNDTTKRTHYAPGSDCRIRKSDLAIQYEFSGALTEKQMKDEMIRVLDESYSRLRDCKDRFAVKEPENLKKQATFDMVLTRLLVLKIFIESGSVTYEYQVNYYDPLA